MIQNFYFDIRFSQEETRNNQIGEIKAQESSSSSSGTPQSEFELVQRKRSSSKFNNFKVTMSP